MPLKFKRTFIFLRGCVDCSLEKNMICKHPRYRNYDADGQGRTILPVDLPVPNWCPIEKVVQ